MSDQITEQLKILQDGIRQDAPLVANFFNTNTPLQQYATELHQYEALPQHRKRQKLFKDKAKEILLSVFTKEELQQANIDWSTDWKINIVDHHGLLNHPILIATNIIGNIHQLPSGQPQGIVVLSDSGVPTNNFFHKRGLLFHHNQLNIFSHKQRHAISYALPTKDSFPLSDKAKQHNLPAEAVKFLTSIEQTLTSTATNSQITSFANQVQRINYELWPLLFHQDIRSQIPNLFYLPNETIAHHLLKEYLPHDNHFFNQVLCDKTTRSLIIKNFTNVTGCWDDQGHHGTHFFWGLNDNHEAVTLRLDNNHLVSSNQDIKIELTPTSISQALDDRLIYPSMFLVYGIAIFHCGIRPLVGYGSMNYQTKMKGAWLKTMSHLDQEEYKLINHIPTDGFIGGPKATFQATEQGYKDLYALDIIYQGGLTKNYLDHLRQMPFRDLLTPALIDIYDSYVKPEHKQAITITSNDLMGSSFSWLQ